MDQKEQKCGTFAMSAQVIVTTSKVSLGCQKHAPKPDADSNSFMSYAVALKTTLPGSINSILSCQIWGKVQPYVEMVNGKVTRSWVRCCHHGICDSDVIRSLVQGRFLINM